MKFQLFALLLVAAGVYAMPPASDAVIIDSPDQPGSRFIVENQIRQIIQQISREIKNAGLDPLVIESEEFVFAPIPFFVEVRAFLEDLRIDGASNIRIHNLNFNLPMYRLRFDISLPKLSLRIGDSGIKGSIFNNKIDGEFRGSFTIESIRLSGEVRLNVGIISGISLRNVSMNFRVASMRSDLTLSAQGTDISDVLNVLLNDIIPNALEDNRVNINRLLENLVREVFDRILSFY